MNKEKLKKLFYEVKVTTSDVIYAAFVFGMLYLLIYAIITNVKRDDNRIKGSREGNREHHHRQTSEGYVP